MVPTGPGTKTFETGQSFERGGSEMFGTLGSVAEWQRWANAWRKATSPAPGAQRQRSGTRTGWRLKPLRALSWTSPLICCGLTLAWRQRKPD